MKSGIKTTIKKWFINHIWIGMFIFIIKQKWNMDHFKLLNFQKGDEGAFDDFFASSYRAFIFFSFRLVRESTVAEDIVVNSFVKLWDKRSQLKSEKELRNYMYKIIYNASLRWLERQKTKKKVYDSYSLHNPESENSYFDNIVHAETIRQVMQAMDELPSECKKVFKKLFVEGKSVNDAAEELQVAVSTIKNQKARGIKLLKAKLT
jgi:RNA polymerase sigma-70 factor (ECF subfamily)